ncbi:MAG: hypothetical protein ABIJ56_02040 [Pseudomonadota bacterium]
MQDRISGGYTDLASRLSGEGEPVFIAPAGLASGPADLDAAEKLALQEIAASVVFGALAPDSWAR